MEGLVITKDKKLARTVSDIFLEHGVYTQLASDFLDGLLYLSKTSYLFVVIELLPPGKNAVTILALLKAICNSHIVGLLRPGIGQRQARCHELADYCLPLPLDESDLHYRIGLKFDDPPDPPPKSAEKKEFFYCRGLIIVPIYRWVYFGHQRIEFTPKEYNLLVRLVQDKDTIVSKERLLADVWHNNYTGGDDTVYTHVTRIRKKLSKLTREECLETVWGLGYRFMTYPPSE